MTQKGSNPSVAEDVEDIKIARAGGGSGGLDAFFVHATGFCKEVWEPVIDQVVADSFSWMSIDQRGHGDSESGRLPNDWDFLARDVMDVLGDHVGVVGVGHSSGGGVIARAEAFRPGMFRHLVLIEPIIFPPPFRRMDGPLSEGTRKRRRTFPSRDVAFKRFASGPFGSWTPDALAAYIDKGFRASADGWELKCDPEVEADFYAEGLNHDTWNRIETIEAPVTLVAGEGSNTHPKPYLDALASQFPDVEVVVVPGAGHLVPMEDPGSIARIIEDVVARG
jgi:pimeloyl-ACP methyl ester carboxylesterase